MMAVRANVMNGRNVKERFCMRISQFLPSFQSNDGKSYRLFPGIDDLGDWYAFILSSNESIEYLDKVKRITFLSISLEVVDL